MIAAVSWVPKGASKAVPEEAEPPSKEEIEEIINSGALEHEMWVFFFSIFNFNVVTLHSASYLLIASVACMMELVDLET